jgi:maleate cis-trans isomerase
MKPAASDTAWSASGPVHVGLMVPANNTTMEGELLGWLPPGSTCHTLCIPRGQGLLTDETLPAYKQAAIELCKQFSGVPLDVIAYGCTAAGFILGPEGDNDIARQLAATSGKPVVTTARSMMLALRDMKLQTISLLTPYQDDVNQRLKAFLQSGDVSVRHFDSFYAADVTALGRITAEEVAAAAQKLCRDDVDALFIACSQLPTLDVVAPLSSAWGKPVLSSIQVTAQYAMACVAAGRNSVAASD